MAYTLRQLIDMIRTVPDVRTALQKLNDKVEGLGGGNSGGGIAPIPSTDSLPEGSINLYFSPQRVRKTSLTGLVTTDNSNVIATDTVLSGIGKLQAKASGYGNVVTYNIGTSGVKVPVLNGINTWSGKQTFSGGIDGSLNGNATSADKVNHELTINGSTYDGSSDTVVNLNAANLYDGTQTLQDINLYGAKLYDMPTGGYPLNGRVILDNGDIVKSTIPNNTNDPNVDMTGWVNDNSASQVFDESGLSQQEINNNTAYFYHMVAAMVADGSLTDGMVVGTKGYHNIFDDGGAIYLISSAATDYSIPLNNGLHAVFRDEFDIRKFGIVSSPTLRQDENLLRMQRYADFHCYEIDFLGFDIVAPKNIIPISLTAADPRITQTRGLWFEHPHYIKNLKYHTDKTVTLENGDCGISYYLTDRFPEFETFIGFENCIMDMWSDNYRAFNDPDNPYFGVADGYRHGISIALSPINHKDQTNYSLIMKNVYFDSPAYSYNIWTDFMLKRQIMESVSGEHLALHIHVAAKEKFISRDCTAIYRSDLLEADRLIVASAIHLEPEISGRDIKFDEITIDNCKAYYANESGIIKDEVSRLFLSYQVAGSTQRIGKLSITNSEGICQINNITSIDSIVFSDLPYFNYFIDGVINANSNAAGDTKPYIGSINISDTVRCSLKLRYASATIGTTNFNLRNFHINEFRSTDEYISDKIQSGYAKHAIADATCIIDNCNLSNVDRITYPLFTGTTVKKLNTSKVKVSHRYSYGESVIKNAELLEFKDTYVGLATSGVGLDTILNTTVDAGVTPPTVIFDGLSVHHDTLGIAGSGIIFNGVGNYTIKNADLPNLPTFAAAITKKIKNLSGASVEKSAQWTTLSTIAAGGKVTLLSGIDAYMPYVTGVDAYLVGVDVDTAIMDLSVKAYVVGRLVRFHIINEGGAPVTLTAPLTIRYKLVI